MSALKASDERSDDLGMTFPGPPSHAVAPLAPPVLDAAPPLSANDGPARSRWAGVGSGFGSGAVAGMAAALAAVVVFASSLAAMSVVTSSGGNLLGGIAFVTFTGAIIAAPLGLVVGGAVGALLAVTRLAAFAPWLAASMSAPVGVLLGQLILAEANGGADGFAIEAIFIVMVVLFAASGWFAGRWFARAVG